MALAKAPVSYNEQNGTLAVSEELKAVYWTPTQPSDASPTTVIDTVEIDNLQQTPESSPNVALRIFARTSGQPGSRTYEFNFTSTSARRDANAIRDAVVLAIKSRTTIDAAPPGSNLVRMTKPKTINLSHTGLAGALENNNNNDDAEKRFALVNSTCRKPMCLNFVERSEYTDFLNIHFQDPRIYHGAASSRILLWGVAGSGKRQIASHFAIGNASATGRTVIWVEAVSLESFIRDYQRAFTQLTGLRLPETLDIFQVLRKVRRALEEHQNEWILVLFDVSLSFVSSANVFGTALVNHLPDWGHILATTSQIFVDIGNIPQTISCALNMAGFIQKQVSEWTTNEVDEYFKLRGIRMGKFEMDGCRREPSEFTPMMTAIYCSSMHHQGMTVGPYRTYFRKRLVKMGGMQETDMLRTLSPVFSAILDIAWSTVCDTDSAAADLLVYLTVVSADEIPIDILQKLRLFVNAPDDRLSRAIALLSSMHLINKSGEYAITIHGLVRRYIELKVQESDKRYIQFIRDWIRAMNDYMTEESPVGAVLDESPNEYTTFQLQRTKAEEYLCLVPHLQSVARTAMKFNIKSRAFVFWLRNVALFMNEDGIFHRISEILISHALSIRNRTRLPGDPPLRSAEIYELVQMSEVKVKALMKALRYREAETQVWSSLRMLQRSNIQGMVRKKMIERFRDYKADVYIGVGDFDEARRILSAQIAQSPSATDFEAARRHQRMAVCLHAIGNSSELVTAVKHSHMAMSYWDMSPIKWDDRELLNWVSEHCSLLLLLDKNKGALRYMLPLVDRYLDLQEYSSEKVWNLVLLIVNRCILHPDMFKDAEDVVIKVLSKVSIGDLSGRAMNDCLNTLSNLADILTKVGRNIEAEAIYRHNVYFVTQRLRAGVDDLNLEGFYCDRLGLLACLEDQGKLEEHHRYQRQFQRLGFDEDMDEALYEIADISKGEWRVYVKALDTLQAGNKIEWMLLSEADQKHLESAVRRLGSLEARVESDMHPFWDLEIDGLAIAKKSRLLHLLELDIAYGAFVTRDGATFVFPNYDQSLIGQYFAFCECRRHRKRSQSLNPVDVIDKRFLVMENKPKPIETRYKQKTILEYFVPVPKIREPTATKEAAAASHNKSKEQGGFLVSDNTSIDSRGGYYDQGLLIPKAKFKPAKISRSPLGGHPGDVCFVDESAGIITWIPGPFDVGDHEDENYIIPNALDIPIIKIHVPPSENPVEDFAKSGITLNGSSPWKKIKITNYFRLEPPEDAIGNRVHRPTRLYDIMEEDAEA